MFLILNGITGTEFEHEQLVTRNGNKVLMQNWKRKTKCG